MSLIFMDGVDDGLSGFKWTSGASRDTSWARTGASSLLVGVSSGVGGHPSLTLPAADRHATMIVGFGYNQHGASNWAGTGGQAGGPICTLGGASGATHVGLYRNTVGGLYIVKGGTLLALSAPSIIVLNTWYHVEMKAVVDDASGSVTVKVNGVTVLTFSGDTRNGETDALVYSVNFTSDNGAGDRQISIDDIFILNGAGSINNDMIGDCSVVTLYPSGNGNYSQWVGSDGNSTDNYLLVDEAGVPNTSDYVESGTATEKDSYVFTDLPGTVVSVKGVAVRAYASKSDVGAQLMRNFVRIGGTDYPSAVDKGPSVTPTYLGFSDIFDQSPATATDWTPAEVNGAEFGVEVR